MIINKFNDIIFKLGSNARENWELIDDADPNDWWFHIDNISSESKSCKAGFTREDTKASSGHCIVEIDVLNDELIKYACSLVIENSKAKKLNKITMIYTQIKNLKKTKTVGEVVIMSSINNIKICKN